MGNQLVTTNLFFSKITNEAKRIWRFAGVFTVALRQGECGRNTC